MNAADALILILFMPVFPFFLHVLLTRGSATLRKLEKRQAGAFIAVCVGAIPVLCLAKDAVMYFGFIYGCIGYSYFHLFNMSETSRRLRIMRDIGAGSTSPFDPGAMVERRLARLTGTGELRRCGERYCIGSGFLLLPAKAVFFLSELLFPGIEGKK
jgi:hypothetical protein